MSTSAGMDLQSAGGSVANESSQPAVSWAAIFSGAFASVATTLILLELGAGVDLSTISPWPNSGASITTFTITTALGLIVVQWLASAIGGYLSGRLRTKWVGVHTYEVFFRDTAHGFLSWTLATVAGGLLFAAGASSIIGGGVHAAATISGGAVKGGNQIVSQVVSSVSAYDVDSLFRSEHPDPAANPQATNEEAMRILVSGITGEAVPAADRSYLAQLVAARAGIAPAEAQKRVDDVIARAEAAKAKAIRAADAARKAASQFAIFTALSMLIGAFIACAAAAYGGSLRDEH